MSRWYLRAASVAALVAGLGMSSADAQNSAPQELGGPNVPSRTAQYSAPGAGMNSYAAPAPLGVPQQAGYVRVQAPLYPSPRPNIPIWTGSTMITNQAFAPHEMLYPHTYRAMYPPFYHRVKGGYIWTPFGMKTHERWELQGTMVQVKYRSSWPKLGGPSKPVISSWGGPWK